MIDTRDRIEIFNDTDEVIPMGGLVRPLGTTAGVTVYTGPYTAEGWLRVGKPSARNQSGLIVVTDSMIPARRPGTGSFDTRCILTFDPKGDRPDHGITLGSQSGSFYPLVGNTGFTCYGGSSGSWCSAVRDVLIDPCIQVFHYFPEEFNPTVGGEWQDVPADSSGEWLRIPYAGLYEFNGKILISGAATQRENGYETVQRPYPVIAARLTGGSPLSILEDASTVVVTFRPEPYESSAWHISETETRAFSVVCAVFEDDTVIKLQAFRTAPFLVLGPGSPGNYGFFWNGFESVNGRNVGGFGTAGMSFVSAKLLCRFDAGIGSGGGSGGSGFPQPPPPPPPPPCTIPGWDGPGFYCIYDDELGRCVPVELFAEDECNEDVQICSVRFDTLPEAEAECPEPIPPDCASECEGNELPLIYQSVLTDADGDFDTASGTWQFNYTGGCTWEGGPVTGSGVGLWTGEITVSGGVGTMTLDGPAGAQIVYSGPLTPGETEDLYFCCIGFAMTAMDSSTGAGTPPTPPGVSAIDCGGSGGGSGGSGTGALIDVNAFCPVMTGTTTGGSFSAIPYGGGCESLPFPTSLVSVSETLMVGTGLPAGYALYVWFREDGTIEAEYYYPGGSVRTGVGADCEGGQISVTSVRIYGIFEFTDTPCTGTVPFVADLVVTP